MSDAELDDPGTGRLPSAGACGGQFTANTMACVSEAIGLALLNSSGAPAPYESRDQYGEASGVAVMNLIEKNIRARDIVTRKSLENAARVVACTGGSTNARPAPARHRARGRDRLRPVRRLRHLPRHALFRRPEAGWRIRRQGSLRGRRRAGGDEGTAQGRADPRGLHHRQRPHASAKSLTRSRRSRWQGDLPGRHPHHQDRRRRRPEGQPRPRRRDREGRRHGAPKIRSSPAPPASSNARKTPSRP